MDRIRPQTGVALILGAKLQPNYQHVHNCIRRYKGCLVCYLAYHSLPRLRLDKFNQVRYVFGSQLQDVQFYTYGAKKWHTFYVTLAQRLDVQMMHHSFPRLKDICHVFISYWQVRPTQQEKIFAKTLFFSSLLQSSLVLKSTRFHGSIVIVRQHFCKKTLYFFVFNPQSKSLQLSFLPTSAKKIIFL